MTILFAGGEIADFVADGGASSTLGRFNSAYARCSLILSKGSSLVRTPEFTPASSLWISTNYHSTGFSSSFSGGNGNEIFMLYKGATPYLKITYEGDERIGAYVFDGGAWVELSGTITNLNLLDGLKRLVVRVVCHETAGEIDVYQDGVLYATYSGVNTQGDNTAGTFDNFHIASPYSTSYCSEVIAATTDLRGVRLSTLNVTGEGTTSEWDGVYTDISGFASADTASISTGVADEVSTYAAGNLPSLGSLNVAAIVTQARAATTGGAPTQLQHAIRSGSTNYFSSSLTLGSLAPTFVVWEQDPNTSALWTAAAVDAAEIGVKAIT